MIPKIGDKITTTMALELCKHYGFEYLVNRIQENQAAFNDWVFDAASMIPNDLTSRVFNIPSLTEIALKHDLKYAYGDPGNKEEKAQADIVFKEELLNDGTSPVIAQIMYKAVDIFGDGPVKTKFSWGFARK